MKHVDDFFLFTICHRQLKSTHPNNVHFIFTEKYGHFRDGVTIHVVVTT